MIYEYFEIKGYNRLALNSTKFLSITMDEIVQVILGRNGCGKSSLIEILDPFPAEQKWFTKDGHKVIKVRHGTDVYTCTSRFSPSAKHSFIKNDSEELNPGGTAAVQKDLCKQIFGITPEIVRIVTGREKFTTMSPQRRRELFTMMSDTDFDYALRLYAKFKEGLSVSKGGLTVAKRRLVTELSNIFPDEEYQRIQEQLNTLTIQSQELYQKKFPNVPALSEAKKDAEAFATRIKDIANRFWSMRAALLVNDTWDASEIQNDIEEIKHKISSTQSIIALKAEQHEELQNKVKNSGQIDDEEYKKLIDHSVAVLAQIEDLKKGLKTPLVILNPQEATDACNRIRDALMSVLTNLPINEEKWFTKAKMDELRTKIEGMNIELANLNVNMTKVQMALARFEEHLKHDETECPSCTHKFRHGYDAKRHGDAKLYHESVSRKITALKEVLDEHQDRFSRMVNYNSMLGQLTSIRMSSTSIDGFWSELLDVEMLDRSPAMLITKFEHYAHDANIYLQINDRMQRLQTIKARIDGADKAKERDVAGDVKRMEQIENEVSTSTQELGLLNKRLISAQTYQRNLRMVQEVEGVMTKLKEQHAQSCRDAISASVNQMIDTALQTTHQEIAVLSNRISDMRVRLALIADLKTQIASLEDDEKAYKLLLDTFSPTDGLIAEGMLGFIRTFVKGMNSALHKFWSYRMTVSDCSAEQGSADLNYRFPLDVEGDQLHRDDVKDGSSGMREAIDLAYRLIAMNYCHLSDYPLVLDEFGAFFDAEHKSRAPFAIKNIIAQMDFKQVFIISHHDMEYSAFPNAQFCVLDKNNIVLNSAIKYNQHVVLA